MSLNAQEPNAAVFWRATRKVRYPLYGISRDAWAREVAAMAEELAYAKAQLNTFAPIDTLPNEILTCVFELLVPLDPIKAMQRYWGWVSVTHVCRRFRAVAHSHATLWSELTVNGDTPWHLFLPRSQQAYLTIRGRAHPRLERLASHYVTLSLQNVARVRHLDITNTPFLSHAATLWLQIFSDGAPELHSLKLELTSAIDEVAESLAQRPTVDPFFLTQGAPKLRELSLDGIHMFWKLEIPIMLRSLHLRRWNTDDERPSFPDVLNCLSNLPLLQELVLWRVLPIVSEHGTKRRVDLPHLRFLSVDDRSEPCLALWAATQLSSQCSIRIMLQTIDYEVQTALCSLIKRHLEGSDCPVYQRLQVGDPEGGQNTNLYIRLSLYAAIDVNDASDAPSKLVGGGGGAYTVGSEPKLDFTFPFGFDGTSHTAPSHMILGSLTIDQIRTLCLTQGLPGAFEYDQLAIFVKGLLSRFSALETIEVRDHGQTAGNPHRSLGQAFCLGFLQNHTLSSTTEMGEAEQPTPFLPHLRTLVLERVSLHCLSWNAQRRVEKPSFKVLTEALQLRAEAHAPLDTIRVSRTPMPSGLREIWEGLVSHVEESEEDFVDSTVDGSDSSVSTHGSELGSESDDDDD
ncbi:unnamed protein product [Peniophora sp. CBMAI 1063]|nr:unnamed protein product [Peniophora sp. CBMAI 1063]